MSEVTSCTLEAQYEAERKFVPASRSQSLLKLSLETHAMGAATVVYCKGRITYREEAVVLSAKVAQLLPQGRPVVLELGGVQMIDSAGLGELIMVFLDAQKSGGTVRLAAPIPRVRQLLQLTNLSSVFEIYSTLEEALVALPKQSA